MRVGIVALLHESNTFIAEKTTVGHFRDDLLLVRDDVRRQMADSHHEVGGFFEELDRQQIEAVGVFFARATPFGTIECAAFDSLLSMMFDALRDVGDLDGLLVAPHGATVSEGLRDADGHWLSRLRQFVGPNSPIIGTLDAHANLSQEMVDATDALVAYRTNPHLDQRARGVEAANLMARTLRGEIHPVQAAAMPPIAIHIACQNTGEEPCLPLYQLADSQLDRSAVLSNSILLGFLYADVEEMGSSVLVVTDGDANLAKQSACELADSLWRNRSQFDRKLMGIDQAIDAAEKIDGPVCLLDVGDNVGGGSPGDGTLLARAICQRDRSRAFVCIFDPAAASNAETAGVGAKVALRVGGKTDDEHGPPIESEFEVLSIHSGRFRESEPRHGGIVEMDQGRTVIVQSREGLTIMITSRRMPPFSLKQLTSCGIDPASFDLLVVKGVNAPIAAYQSVYRRFIQVDTPGVTTAAIKKLRYQHRRRPMFPFEPETSYGPLCSQ